MNSSKHNHQFGKIIAADNVCEKRIQLIRRCTICGYIEHIGLLGAISPHQFSEQLIIKKSTCMTAGRASLKCEKCGYTKHIALPQSKHHYKRNSPFYETCCDCNKKVLTPLTKRMLMISGTVFLTGGFAIFATYFVGKRLHHQTEHDLESVVTVSSEADEKIYVNETVDANVVSSEIHIHNTSKESKETPSSTEPLTSYIAVSSSVGEESTITMSTAYETFNETTTLPMPSIYQQTITPTVIPTQVITTWSEMQTETSEKQTETACTEDYSWLTGEIINGSDLLELIKEGAPIEIITNTGMKFSANTNISGTMRLLDTDMISVTDSYFVQIAFIDYQQVIILNQF